MGLAYFARYLLRMDMLINTGAVSSFDYDKRNISACFARLSFMKQHGRRKDEHTAAKLNLLPYTVIRYISGGNQ